MRADLHHFVSQSLEFERRNFSQVVIIFSRIGILGSGGCGGFTPTTNMTLTYTTIRVVRLLAILTVELGFLRLLAILTVKLGS